MLAGAASQGACAIFNALLEQPGLASFAVAREPFSQNPQR